jgi:hypothetical protein
MATERAGERSTRWAVYIQPAIDNAWPREQQGTFAMYSDMRRAPRRPALGG